MGTGEIEEADFEELKNVVSDVEVGKPRIQNFEVYILDIFCDQAGYLGGGVSDDIQ